MNVFDRINQAIRDGEASLVNLLSALAPWAAPLAPAYMTYSHMTGNLDFPVQIAWAVALVVEVLGLSAISTFLAFWSYNRRYKAQYRKAPVWVVLLSFTIYLAVIITINVLLELAVLFGTQAWVEIAARALLTLLSIPAAMILAVRTQHKEMLDTIQREREKKRQERKERVVTVPIQRDNRGHMQNRFFADVHSGKLDEKLNGQPLAAPAVASIYAVSERTAYRWLSMLKKGGVTAG